MTELAFMDHFCRLFQTAAHSAQRLFQRVHHRQLKPLSWLQYHCARRQVLDLPTPPLATAAGPEKIAIVVHIHYADLWSEISMRLQALHFPFDLIVTVTGQAVATILQDDLNLHFPNAPLLVMENRGRDVAPFLQLLTDGKLAPYDLVCKLHAKKSPHRSNGTAWRATIFDSLIGSHAQATCCIDKFVKNPALGMLGPRAYDFDQARHFSTNGPWLLRLAKRFGIGRTAFGQNFFAGTMFWVRPSALAPLMAADDLLQLFESEAGQIDGMLAHSLERAMPMIVHQSGYQIQAV